jgi:hypothetical protein
VYWINNFGHHGYVELKSSGIVKVLQRGRLDLNLDRTSFFFSPIFVVVLTIFIDITGFGMVLPLLPFLADSLQAGSTALDVRVRD